MPGGARSSARDISRSEGLARGEFSEFRGERLPIIALVPDPALALGCLKINHYFEAKLHHCVR
jgi:hypothetical protein